MEGEIPKEMIKKLTDQTLMASRSQKLQDDLKELGERIKHHEANIKYLNSLKNKLDESIHDMQVAIGKYDAPIDGDSMEVTLEQIYKYEKCNAAAAILHEMNAANSKEAAADQEDSLTTDVLGVVATLGRVDDPTLSRVLSEYVGLESMLGVVCKTYAGGRALEGYNKDGSLDNQIVIICLENLRPYGGAKIVDDDPQPRLDLPKPRAIGGEAPPGFIGFAVNMVTIDHKYTNYMSKKGFGLRETLFYNLFSDLQVYESREDMLNAQAYIPHAAISLDGGVIRRSGIFTIGRDKEIDVKFPRRDSKNSNLPANYYEIEKQFKETKWKKDRAHEDMLREQALLDHARGNYNSKRQEFIDYISQTAQASFGTSYPR